MGLCKTSNFSLFAFTKDNYLKFCARSYSSCVYRMMRFKGSNGKVCKMMTSHFGTLQTFITDRTAPIDPLHLHGNAANRWHRTIRFFYMRIDLNSQKRFMSFVLCSRFGCIPMMCKGSIKPGQTQTQNSPLESPI